MRPIYESNANLRDERLIADYIESKSQQGLKLYKMHMKQRIDFMGIAGNLAHSVYEVKRRHNNHDQYPTLILSLEKFSKGIEFFTNYNLGFYFVVAFDDGVYYYQYRAQDRFAIDLGGRTDRNDKQDIEPVIHIPKNRLIVL
jgi:hypothetical protein